MRIQRRPPCWWGYSCGCVIYLFVALCRLFADFHKVVQMDTTFQPLKRFFTTFYGNVRVSKALPMPLESRQSELNSLGNDFFSDANRPFFSDFGWYSVSKIGNISHGNPPWQKTTGEPSTKLWGNIEDTNAHPTAPAILMSLLRGLRNVISRRNKWRQVAISCR